MNLSPEACLFACFLLLPKHWLALVLWLRLVSWTPTCMTWGQPLPGWQGLQGNFGAGMPGTISPCIFPSSSWTWLPTSSPPGWLAYPAGLQSIRWGRGLGTEFSWEWRKRSGGYGMDCPEDRRLVVSQLALRAAQKDS